MSERRNGASARLTGAKVAWQVGILKTVGEFTRENPQLLLSAVKEI